MPSSGVSGCRRRLKAASVTPRFSAFGCCSSYNYPQPDLRKAHGVPAEDHEGSNRMPRHRSRRSILKKQSSRSPDSTPSIMRTPRHISAVSTASHSLLRGTRCIAALTIFALGWVSVNGFAAAVDYRALDPPLFPWLAGATSLASLYLVVLILTTQRGDDRLTLRRELLNLGASCRIP